MSDFGVCLSTQGKHKEDLVIEGTTLASSISILGIDLIDTLNTRANLVGTLIHLQLLDEAKAHVHMVLVCRDTITASQNPNASVLLSVTERVLERLEAAHVAPA